jgi:hypothetical protein
VKTCEPSLGVYHWSTDYPPRLLLLQARRWPELPATPRYVLNRLGSSSSSSSGDVGGLGLLHALRDYPHIRRELLDGPAVGSAAAAVALHAAATVVVLQGGGGGNGGGRASLRTLTLPRRAVLGCYWLGMEAHQALRFLALAAYLGDDLVRMLYVVSVELYVVCARPHLHHVPILAFGIPHGVHMAVDPPHSRTCENSPEHAQAFY